MKQECTDDIIKRHEGLVYYTLQILNCAYSDEAVSVAYEALWRAIKTFDKSKGAQFSTYATVCIRNAVYDMFRDWKEIRDAEIPLEDYKDLYTVDTHEHEEQQRSNPIVSKAVDDALNSLSPKRRSIAEHWLEYNMSATAIAQEVGCSQSYASQTIKEFKVVVRKELFNAGYSTDPS